jgi:putative membrane protein
MAFIHALRHQLRGSDAQTDLARLLPAADVQRVGRARYKPAALLLMIGEWAGETARSGRLPAAAVLAAEVPLSGLTQALGGCERIAGTPIPFTYVLILHRTIFLYSVLLPFGLVDSIRAWTPLVVGFIAYTFFALEALCAELEEPFGLAPNDLALDAMSLGIENSLRELLGEHPLPPEALPLNGVLS